MVDSPRQYLKIFPLTRDEPENPLYPRSALKVFVWLILYSDPGVQLEWSVESHISPFPIPDSRFPFPLQRIEGPVGNELKKSQVKSKKRLSD